MRLSCAANSPIKKHTTPYVCSRGGPETRSVGAEGLYTPTQLASSSLPLSFFFVVFFPFCLKDALLISLYPLINPILYVRCLSCLPGGPVNPTLCTHIPLNDQASVGSIINLPNCPPWKSGGRQQRLSGVGKYCNLEEGGVEKKKRRRSGAVSPRRNTQFVSARHPLLRPANTAYD